MLDLVCHNLKGDRNGEYDDDGEGDGDGKRGSQRQLYEIKR